jgi:hypothetical protein
MTSERNDDPSPTLERSDLQKRTLQVLLAGGRRGRDGHGDRSTRRFRLEFRPDSGGPVQTLAVGPDAKNSYRLWANRLLQMEATGWLVLIDPRTNGPIIRRHLAQ